MPYKFDAIEGKLVMVVKGDTGATGVKGDKGDAGTNGTNGTNGTDGEDGTSFVWESAYVAGTAYTANDVVSYGGSSYICILASTGNLPTNATYWALMAQKGEVGSGTGDVVGPASAVDSNFAGFNTTTGKLIKDSGSKASDFATSGHNHTGTYAPILGADDNYVTDTEKMSIGTIGDRAPIASPTFTGTLTTPAIKITTGAGAGKVLTSDADGDATWEISTGGGTTWSVITDSATAAVNNGYIANKGTLLTLTLPDTAAAGSVIRIAGMNAGLWKIAQNASEIIHFGNLDTTTGATGYISSTHARDSVELVCVVANVEWQILSSQGNITVA